MKILFVDWFCFDREETKEAFRKMGHEVIEFFHEDYNMAESEGFHHAMGDVMEKQCPDFVFSYNYFPLVAIECKEKNTPYISFLYDSPYAFIYSYTLMFETNYVFLFDSSMVDEFRRGGLTNVYYMNLPGVPDKIFNMLQKPYDKKRMESDISFVGALYHEKHNFYERIDWSKNPYVKGFVNGLMDAQMKVNGYNFIEECLTPDILKQLQELYPLYREEKSVESEAFRFADYVINRKITAIERKKYLEDIGLRFGKNYKMKLFTIDQSICFQGIENMGVAEYETEMPYVFYHSKINLNISLRSIKTGIPLRCMDIMSSKGFLLSNFQSDFLIDFVPGEDFVYYENEEDMLDKIEYYLTHEKERMEIAENGYEKVKKYFSLEDVLQRMMGVVFE